MTASEDHKRRARRLSNRGAAYLRDGEPKKALSLLRRAHQLLPEDVAIAINLAGAYILQGQHQDAVSILEHALVHEPANEMLWTNLGAAYLGNPILATDEQQQAAIDAFERAIEINPLAPNVHYNLGLIHRDRGETEQAIHRFRQALQANPHDRDASRALQRLVERLQ
ncbi:MAG: tetratricopeptide repeat protein [Anaerolineae bacterium]